MEKHTQSFGDKASIKSKSERKKKTTSTGNPVPIDFSELDSFLQRHRLLFKRATVLIRKNGKVVYTFGDTLAPMNAASCTKWLGAATIMRLVEKQLLDLDIPAGVYQKTVPHNGKLFPKNRPRVRQLTLRQLLSHTGGLSALDPFAHASNNASVAQDGTAQLTPYRNVMNKLRFRSSRTPVFCYENAGFNFAGQIATWVTNKPWPVVFQDEIGTPLGMFGTYFSKQKPSLAAGGMVSAADYSRFLEMIRNEGVSMEGRRILSRNPVGEMLKNQTTGLRMACVPRPSPRKESYGLGIWRQGPGARPWLASHFGTSGYKVFLDFCRDLTAVFALEYKPKRKKYARDATRSIYEIVQRTIPVSAACAKEMEADRHQWKPPLRPPPRQNDGAANGPIYR